MALIKLSVADPDRDDLTLEAQYSEADEDEWVAVGLASDTLAGEIVGLEDGKKYDVRTRWRGGSGAVGPWALIENVAAVADPVAPIALKTFTGSGGIGRADLALSTGNDQRTRTVNIYRMPAGAAFNPTIAAATTPVVTLQVGPNGSYSHVDGDPTRTNIVTNGDFASSAGWTLGSGWTIASGKATKTAGAEADAYRAVSLSAVPHRFSFTMSGHSAGVMQLWYATAGSGSGIQNSANLSGNGFKAGVMTPVAANNSVFLHAFSTFAGSLDDLVVYAQTADCAPQGEWDYYAVPANGSGVLGPISGPLTRTVQ